MPVSVAVTVDDERIRIQQQRELLESRRLVEDAMRKAAQVDIVLAKIGRMNRIYFERLHGTRGRK